MTASTTTKLAPCPFCGCRRVRVWSLSASAHVSCIRCASSGPSVDVDWSADGGEETARRQAAAAWERRVHQ